jgi:ketosteroid isomerase-like protein
MVKSLRIRRRSPALVLSLLLLAGGENASLADPPGPAGATETNPPSSSHGGFLSSLKQAFSQNVERDVVWAHFDVGSAPDTHRFYCLLDPKTGKREPNGVAGEPFQRRDGTIGLKGPAISPVSCSDAEQKGLLVTSGYTIKPGAGSASGSVTAPLPTPSAAPAAAAASAPAAAAAPAATSAPAAAAAAVTAVAPAAAPHPQGSDLRAQMESANANFLAAYNTQNGAAFKGMYTPDAMLFAPSTQPLVGAEAIAAFWADRIKGGNRKNHTFEIVSVWADGRYAYQVARYTVDVVNDKGEIFKSAGNTVRIFEKQADGKWLTKVHIFNSY